MKTNIQKIMDFSGAAPNHISFSIQVAKNGECLAFGFVKLEALREFIEMLQEVEKSRAKAGAA